MLSGRALASHMQGLESESQHPDPLQNYKERIRIYEQGSTYPEGSALRELLLICPRLLGNRYGLNLYSPEI